jgi:RimJ/RimL family protein N-acetyltransferase
MQGHLCHSERSPILISERLILRHWRESDREPFARVNADLRVMEYMPHAVSKEDSDALADRIEADFRQHGFGLCAVELPQNGSFPSRVGMMVEQTGITLTRRATWS